MSDLVAGKMTKLEASPIPSRAARNYSSDISALLRFSARIGRDPLLVQASSGNTSLKLNGTLWIKASGKWLAKADQQEILVPVSLSECLERFEQGGSVPTCNGSL